MKIPNTRFYNTRLRTKFVVSILAVSVLIFSVIIAVITIKSKKDTTENAFKFVDASASEYANMIMSSFENDFATCRTIVSSFANYRNIESADKESYYNETLKTVLLNNPRFVSLWADWELSNLDASYKKEHGRESFTFYKEGNEIKYENIIIDTSGNPEGVYYDIKASPSEILTEPYYYSYTGNKEDEILEASVCIPIMDNGRFIGLLGADVELSQIEEIIGSIKPFDGSYAVLVSSTGILVNYEGAFNNSVITDTDLAKNIDFSILNKFELGNPFSYAIKDEEGSDYYISFSPLSLGRSLNKWYLGIVVPKKVVLRSAEDQVQVSFLLSLSGLVLLTLIVLFIANMVTKPLKMTTKVLNELAKGNVTEVEPIEIKTHDELAKMGIAVNTLVGSLKSSAGFANSMGREEFDRQFVSLGEKDLLGNALLNMRDRLQELKGKADRNNWMHKSVVEISDVLQGEKSLAELGNEILIKFAKILDIQVAALYINENEVLRMVASYAYDKKMEENKRIEFGEGLVGQSAIEQKSIVFEEVPDDYISITSGLGKSKASSIIIIPLVFQNKLIGIVELAGINKPDNKQTDFLDNVSENIAIALRSIIDRVKMMDLLAETQEQAEELKVQQEELVNANKGLKAQTEALRVSEEELQQQQEELRVTNEELEVKTNSLELQKASIGEKNIQLENAQKDLERKANELGIASKYKSDFLANMSHELRTPLNSLLILSRDLADNSNGNLDADQIEASEIIFQSGSDLLSMINDILDLSKIESGKMHVNVEEIDLTDVGETITGYFKLITKQKGITFGVEFDDGLKELVKTDKQKLEQILKNFISNAIKFTTEGGVKVRFHLVEDEIELAYCGLNNSEVFAVSVIDTGIGIPKNKQLEIFEAFQQADTSISKNYGGTGLGLSISKELAKLLGGEIQMTSKEGEGSVFTVYLPLSIKPVPDNKTKKPAIPKPDISRNKLKQEKKVLQTDIALEDRHFVPDDYSSIKANDKFILIIEDDENFAKILVKESHNNGFKCIAVSNGEDGVVLARNEGVAAIILDINLPGINGWAVLKLLKNDPATRHIPVHIMSGEEDVNDSGLIGAIGYLRKPADRNSLKTVFGRISEYISKEVGNLLLVEDDDNLRLSIKKIIGEEGITITDATHGGQVLELLSNNNYDCMILDLGLPDMSGFELIEEMERRNISKPPIIVYTGRDITREENDMLEKYAETVIIKGVRSAERLLDETALFMHRVVSDMPKKQQEVINTLHDKEEVFRGKKVLVVDDDMRNVFALTSLLSKNGMEVFRAENGKVAIEQLQENNNIDIILMDIMMPVMDGYEAMEKIRKIKTFVNTPIIALTAKAMKGDKQKCINSGASDYMAKPIEIDKLLSLMRVWLYK